PGVEVGIEMDQAEGTVPGRQRAQKRQRDGVIAAEADQVADRGCLGYLRAARLLLGRQRAPLQRLGGGLEYQNHRLSYNNFVTLAWGLTAGYWYNYYNKYDGFALSYTDTEEYYFGGPLVKLELGFGELPLRIFYKSTLLFGNAVCFRQDYGLYFALTRPAGK
nr:hypothetical protein [Chitinispirillaceae bacterium]